MKYSDIHLSYKSNFTTKYEKYRKYPYLDKNHIETSKKFLYYRYQIFAYIHKKPKKHFPYKNFLFNKKRIF